MDYTNKYLIEDLARAFFDELDSHLTHGQMLALCEANARETDPNICHSHDWLDANECMADAWSTIEGLPELDMQNEEHCALWNAAWSECKASYLQYSAEVAK